MMAFLTAAILASFVALPWPLVRTAVIPLGRARLAYYAALAAPMTFVVDRKGGAALAGAWALALSPDPDEADAAWLAGILAGEARLGGAGVAAAAMLEAARGHRAEARELFAAVLGVDDRACPAEAKRIARAWLASDAAERGEWAKVAELGSTLARGGRLAWLLAGVAESLRLEPDAPGPIELWLRWALAPRRAATRPMVQRAIAARGGAFVDAEDEAPIKPAVAAPSDDALGTAIALHAAVLSRPAKGLRADDLRAVGQAWDAALEDGATERLLFERALLLGGGAPAETLARVQAAVEEDLASAALASGVALAEPGREGAMVGRARARLRDRLLSEIEAASDAIRRRVDQRRALPAPDEWREWASLVARYEHAVMALGDELRRLAFAKVYPDASAYAVWLFNDRHETPLGNAIFRFLLAEATALGDQRAIALQTKNVGCGV